MDVSAVATGTGTPDSAVIDTGIAASAPHEAAPAPAQHSQQPVAAPSAAHRAGIASAVAKLFGGSASSLSVSYRVVKDLDEIVTVFSDPNTGKEVAQFPAEALIGLAQFFDHERGATLDKNA